MIIQGHFSEILTIMYCCWMSGKVTTGDHLPREESLIWIIMYKSSCWFGLDDLLNGEEVGFPVYFILWDFTMGVEEYKKMECEFIMR